MKNQTKTKSANRKKTLIIFPVLLLLGLCSALSSWEINEEKTKAEIKKLETQLKDAAGKERIELLIKLGKQYLSLPDRYADSIKLGKQALQLAEKENMPGLQVSALGLMSLGYRITHEYETGYQIAQKAVALAKHIKDGKKIKEAYDHLIDLCSYWDYTKAFQHHKEYRAFVKDDHELASWNQVMAHIYVNLDLQGQAEEHVKKAAVLFEKVEDHENHARMLVYLGSFLRRAKKFQQAVDMMDRAYQIAVKHNTPYAVSRALDAKARVYLAAKSYDKAIPLFEETRKYSREHKFRGMVNGVHLNLAELYLEIEQPGKALVEITPLYDFCLKHDYFWLPQVALLKGDILYESGKGKQAWEAYLAAHSAANRFNNKYVLRELIKRLFFPLL